MTIKNNKLEKGDLVRISTSEEPFYIPLKKHKEKIGIYLGKTYYTNQKWNTIFIKGKIYRFFLKKELKKIKL